MHHKCTGTKSQEGKDPNAFVLHMYGRKERQENYPTCMMYSVYNARNVQESQLNMPKCQHKFSWRVKLKPFSIES